MALPRKIHWLRPNPMTRKTEKSSIRQKWENFCEIEKTLELIDRVKTVCKTCDSWNLKTNFSVAEQPEKNAYFRVRLIIELSIRIFSRSTFKIKIRL